MNFQRVAALQDLARRLLHLSEEEAADLSKPAPEAAILEFEAAVAGDPTSRDAAATLARYRARQPLLAGEGLNEGAWVILLDLSVSLRSGRTVSVTSACYAAALPPTTALRYVALLEAGSLIERTPDPSDARRSHLAITGAGVALVDRVLRAQAAAEDRLNAGVGVVG